MHPKLALRLLIALALVAGIGLAFSPASPAHAASTLYVGTNSTGNPGTCTYNATTYSPCYTSLGTATSVAGTGATIIVFPGTYNECMVFTNWDNLTIKSANNAGIVPWSASRGPEAIIVGGIYVSSNNVTIDGLSITGGMGAGGTCSAGFPAYMAGYGVFSGGATGTQLLHNNIYLTTAAGVDLNSSPGGSPGLIEGNYIHNNGAAGITADYVVGMHDTIIEDNRIIANTGAGILFPLPLVANYTSGNDEIYSNQITNNGAGGIVVSDQGYGGPLYVAYNRIVGNGVGIANNSVTPTAYTETSTAVATVHADNNWWGCQTGPNTAGCDTVTGPGSTITTTWLQLHAYTGTSVSFTSCTGPTSAPAGSTVTITADLRCNTTGTVTTGVANGTPVRFSTTCGTVTPIYQSPDAHGDNGQPAAPPNNTAPPGGTVVGTYAGIAQAQVTAPAVAGTTCTVTVQTDNATVVLTITSAQPPNRNCASYVQGSYSNPGGTRYPGYTANVGYQFFVQTSSTGVTSSSSYLTFSDLRTGTQVTIKSTTNITMVPTGPNSATIYGTGTQTTTTGGVSTSQTVTYTVHITGNSTNPNTFQIQTSTGYNSGVITSPPRSILVNNGCPPPPAP